MAYSFYYVGPKTGKTFRLYNVDYSVGQGGTNLKDDVMLVQSLLHILYVENTDPELTAKYPSPLTGDTDFAIDGICGSDTKRCIAAFKSQARAIGFDLYADSIMDPLRKNDPSVLSKVSKSQYSLAVLLDQAHQAAERSGNVDKIDNLPWHPDTPPPLQSALMQSRDQALQYTATSWG